MIPDNSIAFYKQIQSKKRSWQPIKPGKTPIINPEAEPTLKKALALSKLELPVGAWMTEELEKNPNLPPSLFDLLRANIDDEIKHDEALNNIRAVFPVPSELDSQVDQFINRATKLADLYSPVTLTAVIESSVFFVILPMFRFLGSPVMRNTASDISMDENTHVSTNIQLCKDLGYRKGKALDSFRSEIIDWLTLDLNEQHTNKYLSASFWKESSSSLYSQGKADGLSSTKRAIMPAFFEHDNQNLPIYN